MGIEFNARSKFEERREIYLNIIISNFVT